MSTVAVIGEPWTLQELGIVLDGFRLIEKKKCGPADLSNVFVQLLALLPGRAEQELCALHESVFQQFLSNFDELTVESLFAFVRGLYQSRERPSSNVEGTGDRNSGKRSQNNESGGLSRKKPRRDDSLFFSETRGPRSVRRQRRSRLAGLKKVERDELPLEMRHMGNSPLVRRWVRCEFCYSSVAEENVFIQNDFQDWLASQSKISVKYLTRKEWSYLRMGMGIPRRLSARFLQQERLRLFPGTAVRRPFAPPSSSGDGHGLRARPVHSIPSVSVMARMIRLLEAKDRLLLMLQDLSHRKPSQIVAEQFEKIREKLNDLNIYLDETEDSIREQIEKTTTTTGASTRYVKIECLSLAEHMASDVVREVEPRTVSPAARALLVSCLAIAVALRMISIRHLDATESTDLMESLTQAFPKVPEAAEMQRDQFFSAVSRILWRMIPPTHWAL